MIQLRRSKKISEAGFMHVGFACILVLCICSSIFMLGTLIRWRHQVELQLRLDQCVGRTALDLKRSLKRVETLNLTITATRASIAASAAAPAVAATLQTALLAQVTAQEAVLRTWDLKRLDWVLQRGCDSKRDLAFPLPAQPWQRDPPDSIGPQALTWVETEPRQLKILTRHGIRFSAALVEDRNAKDQRGGFKSDWKAKWTSQFAGTGFN